MVAASAPVRLAMIKKNTNANPAASKAKKSIPPSAKEGLHRLLDLGIGIAGCGVPHGFRYSFVVFGLVASHRYSRNDKEKKRS